MTKSKVLPSIVLGAICLISALLLSVLNTFTAPEIEQKRKEAEIKALKEVLVDGTYFDPIEITEAYPEIVTGGYKSDAGYVFKVEVKGYQPGLVIMVGVDNDGRIAGVKHTASNETFGAESELNQKYTDKKDNQDSLEMLLSASASKGAPLTSAAYYKAVDAALESAKIASGKGARFTGVESYEITADGNYVFVAFATGKNKIRIKISISADGKINYVKTLSHSETPKYENGILNDGSNFQNSFTGLDKDGASNIGNVGGATMTSEAFKKAVSNAFKAYEVLKAEGGNQ